MGQTVARRCPALPCTSSCRGQLGPQSKVEDMVRERGQGEGEERDAGKMEGMQLGKDWDAAVAKRVHLGGGGRQAFHWGWDNPEVMMEGRVRTTVR